MNNSAFDRSAAEEELKATAAEASYHSSGDVLNMADPKSKFAHGKLHRSGSVDENTSMPTTETTVSGAYAIGETSTADVAGNYDNKFVEPASHVSGQGSRTIQPLPEQVTHLGSTVETNRTTHVIQTEREPVQYIPSQGSYTEPTGQTTTTTTRAAAQMGTQSGSSGTQANSASTTGQTTLNAGSHAPTSSNSTAHAEADNVSKGHLRTTMRDTSSPAAPATEKTSFMSKVKHAFSG